jgi:flagellar hook protein FlgE
MVSAVSSAISALQSIGKKFGVSANNVANLNTSGYKTSSASSTNASGGGSVLSEISESFSQGAFVTTGSSTDLAISGDGYFILSGNDGETYYTRDGEFDFDAEGNLVDSSGNMVQGWALDPESGEITGSIGDITLEGLRTAPQATTTLSATVNLDAGAANNSAGTNALSAAWDGDSADGTYIDTDAYAYSTSATVYDSQGGQHDVTIYFDQSDTTNEWEYIVTANPGEDGRTGASGDDLGLLARGTLSFDTSGTLTEMTMAVNDGSGTWTELDPDTDISAGNFSFQADFLGDAGGSTVMNIDLDFGASYTGTQWVAGADASTQYASASSTVRFSSDGSAPGELLSVSVGSDGVVSGAYSNGDTVDLFQIAVARFTNTDGLEKVGGNLYSATSESGQAVTGVPGSGGLGSIVSNALEESNVDLAQEFVNMTILQRSYEANLKVIQVEDEMKGDVLDIIS